MAEVLFISENTLRAITNCDNNLQSKFLQSAIREAQMDYEQIVGTILYRKLKTLIEENHIGDSGNTAYKELLDNSKYFLAYDALAKCIVMASVKISNAGAMQASDEHLQSLNLQDSYALEEYYIRKADFYLKRLQRYILSQQTKLPELKKYERYAIKAELWSAYSGGLWLGGKKNKGRLFPRFSFGYDNKNDRTRQ